MPVNPGFEYQRAELEYQRANTLEEKLAAARKMLQLVPKHKSSENLVAEIKKRISKLLKLQEKQKEVAKRAGRTVGLKKEGAARVCIVGAPNTGKSTLLSKITNAKPTITNYPFATKEPEVGILDYQGIKIQVVEIPAIVENFLKTENAGYFVSLIKEASFIVIAYRDDNDRKLVKSELRKMNVRLPFIEYNWERDTAEQVKYNIWLGLDLIKVFTKQPHKKKDFPPVALKKGSTVRELASKIHKDFILRFKFARIYGSSVKFQGQQVGLQHILVDEDVVELHMKD